MRVEFVSYRTSCIILRAGCAIVSHKSDRKIYFSAIQISMYVDRWSLILFNVVAELWNNNSKKGNDPAFSPQKFT